MTTIGIDSDDQLAVFVDPPRFGQRPRNQDEDDVGITEANLSLLKSGKVKGIRFSTLRAICEYLECQPGDILEYRADPADKLEKDDEE